jgi:hypothetical protein
MASPVKCNFQLMIEVVERMTSFLDSCKLGAWNQNPTEPR